MHRVKEVDDTLSELVLEIELLALGYLYSTLDQISSTLIYIL